MAKWKVYGVVPGIGISVDAAEINIQAEGKLISLIDSHSNIIMVTAASPGVAIIKE